MTAGTEEAKHLSRDFFPPAESRTVDNFTESPLRLLAAEEQNSPKDVEASAAVASNERAEAGQAIGIVSQQFFGEDQTDRRPTDAREALNVEHAAAMGISAVLQDEVTPSPTAPGDPCTLEDPLTGRIHGTHVDCGGELDFATAGGCGLSK